MYAQSKCNIEIYHQLVLEQDLHIVTYKMGFAANVLVLDVLSTFGVCGCFEFLKTNLILWGAVS